MARPERLTVWLHDLPVAEIERGRRGRIRLSYTDVAYGRFPLNTPILSCAVPLSHTPQDAAAFIDGVLPEGDHRRLLAERARIPAHDSFGLIARYGRDIAGAAQFLPDGADLRTSQDWALEELDSRQLSHIVADLPANPLAIVDESELSLAGLQNKMLLVRLGDEGWARPLHGRPSTHILKRDSDRHIGIIAAERDGLALARHTGLTDVEAWVERYGDYDCLIVQRFDRIVEGGEVTARIHQEDACQALGLPATRKYEIHHGGGGPTLAQIAGLLDEHAADPVRQLDRLAAVAAFTVIIGNADCHGKNIAFLHDVDGHIRLSPLYDTVPTVLWPSLRTEPAMALGGAVSAGGMNLAAIEREAKEWRHNPDSAAAAASESAERLVDAVNANIIDPDGLLARQVVETAKRFQTS